MDIISIKCRCYTEYKPVLFEKKNRPGHYNSPGLSCELPKSICSTRKTV